MVPLPAGVARDPTTAAAGQQHRETPASPSFVVVPGFDTLLLATAIAAGRKRLSPKVCSKRDPKRELRTEKERLNASATTTAAEMTPSSRGTVVVVHGTGADGGAGGSDSGRGSMEAGPALVARLRGDMTALEGVSDVMYVLRYPMCGLVFQLPAPMKVRSSQTAVWKL